MASDLPNANAIELEIMFIIYGYFDFTFCITLNVVLFWKSMSIKIIVSSVLCHTSTKT